ATTTSDRLSALRVTSSRTRSSAGAKDTDGSTVMLSGASPDTRRPAPAVIVRNANTAINGRREQRKCIVQNPSMCRLTQAARTLCNARAPGAVDEPTRHADGELTSECERANRQGHPGRRSDRNRAAGAINDGERVSEANVEAPR